MAIKLRVAHPHQSTYLGVPETVAPDFEELACCFADRGTSGSSLACSAFSGRHHLLHGVTSAGAGSATSGGCGLGQFATIIAARRGPSSQAVGRARSGTRLRWLSQNVVSPPDEQTAGTGRLCGWLAARCARRDELSLITSSGGLAQRASSSWRALTRMTASRRRPEPKGLLDS